MMLKSGSNNLFLNGKANHQPHIVCFSTNFFTVQDMVQAQVSAGALDALLVSERGEVIRSAEDVGPKCFLVRPDTDDSQNRSWMFSKMELSNWGLRIESCWSIPKWLWKIVFLTFFVDLKAWQVNQVNLWRKFNSRCRHPPATWQVAMSPKALQLWALKLWEQSSRLLESTEWSAGMR